MIPTESEGREMEKQRAEAELARLKAESKKK